MEGRTDRATPENIQQRIRYLKDIMSKKIPLEKGQMEWLNKPESIRKNVTETGGTFSEIGKGVYSKVFKVCIDRLCRYEFILKETMYRQEYYEDIDYPYRIENMEPKILKILNDFIYTGVTPHILLYLGDFTAYANYIKYKYLLMEKADTDFEKIYKNLKNESLKSESAKNDAEFIVKNILFQTLYTLRVIQKKYPDFIHNDLKLDNILCFNPNKNLENKFYKYTLDGENYYIPHTYRTVLSDFGLSSINSKDCNNSYVEILNLEQKLGIQTDKNPYKDVYKLFAMIRDFYAEKNGETYNFVKKFLYGKKDEYYNLLPNITPYKIEEMLKDPYFDVYRVPVEENKIIEEFFDAYLEDRSLTNLNAMPDMTQELVFNCNDYKINELWYADYKINDKLNDPYRKNCLPGHKNKIEKLDYSIPKYIKFEITVSSKENRENTMIMIENIYKYLLEKYANEVNIPAPNIEEFKAAIYRKACMYVTRYYPQIKEDEPYMKLIDAIIQYNKFLSSGGDKM